jgi:hypothetical protein
MLPANKLHFKKVSMYGGGLAALLAGLSLLKFPLLVAGSVLVGAVLGLFNIYSIVMLVEALAGAAAASAGKGVRIFSTVLHMLKLGLILAVLFVLVYYRLTNLIALLVGFTAVILANLLVGFSGLGRK